MSVHKRPKHDPLLSLSRNSGLNRSIRTMDRKKRIHNQIHVGLQDRLEKEMKIRDGATRLLGACTHETQLLEAGKTLHTSNARTLVYMSQLQKLRAAEVMEVSLDEPCVLDDSRVCKGRVAVSDIRVPLTWKGIFNVSKAKESTRHAVFCLVTVGSEVQDTELVCVDKNTTDISFPDIVVFENACYNFKMKIDLFACPMSANTVSAPTPQKLISRLNRSVGKIEGKRMREHMKENITNGVKSVTPIYTKIASSVLTLCDVSDAFKSHDLDQTNQQSVCLPLDESVTCRLVAQPKCLTDISLSGFLHYLHTVGAVPNWSYLWCEVKAGVMKGWRRPEESNKDPQFAIDLIPKDVKANEIEKSRQRRPHSFQVRDLTDRHIFAAGDAEELIKWIRGIRQHKSDHGAWGVACISDPSQRTPMFIASPSPRNVSSELIFDRGVRKTIIYDQLSVDSPLKTITQSVECCTNMLTHPSPDSDRMVAQSVHSVLLENQTTAPWTGFFTGLGSKPAKIIKKTDVQRNHATDAVSPSHPYNLRPLRSSPNTRESMRSQSQATIFNDTSDLDDKFPGKSPGGRDVEMKKKRRAPMSPWDDAAFKSPVGSPPSKPPLPKLPPKMKALKQSSVSSASSLDDILEDQHSGQPSGYKSETENADSKLGERSWQKAQNCVIPAGARTNAHCFKKSKSLDCDDVTSNDTNLIAPPNDRIDVEKRIRTNTMPKSSPSRTRPRNSPQLSSVLKATTAPRRSYLSAVESGKTKPVYETVKFAAQGEQSPGLSYRRLHYDENAQVYCQAMPPALPPKKSKTVAAQTSTEPVYAEIDKVKKREERDAKSHRGVTAYTKAHRAIITVCKQRMEEEESKLKSASNV